MRKYFLLSAVALMITGTANATTDYAEVTAKATIEVAGTFTCSDMNFGTIVVKQGNSEIIIDGELAEVGNINDNDDLISISGVSMSTCSVSDNDDYVPMIKFSENLLTLTNDNGDEITVSGFTSNIQRIFGTLVIPSNVKAGDYTGSFTVTHTY
ncbi:MAG: DUF4402 domain-containing protein [Alphaproteobacteria bacterium]|nr:DUF4402 domain-containing protein [Alphaproteobacteria bacterium]